MSTLPGRLAQLALAVFVSWLVVGTALWILGGPTLGATLEVAVACTLALGLAVWWISGRFSLARTRWPLLIGVNAMVAVAFGAAMVAVTHAGGAAAVGAVADGVARDTRMLGAEFTFWIWLYAALALGSYGIRVKEAVREERDTLLRARGQVAEARLASLRGQLNPHFLFNALHGITALVQSDPARASEALERLGDLLRYSLDGATEETVTLSEELGFTRTYLDLMSMTLGDRLRTELALGQVDRSVPVPPFSLQVLVENAVRHGVEPSVDGGTVHIGVAHRGDALELVVENDVRGEARASGPGMGLSNLRERLDVLYAGEATLDTARTEAGHRARLVLPSE